MRPADMTAKRPQRAVADDGGAQRLAVEVIDQCQGAVDERDQGDDSVDAIAIYSRFREKRGRPDQAGWTIVRRTMPAAMLGGVRPDAKSDWGCQLIREWLSSALSRPGLLRPPAAIARQRRMRQSQHRPKTCCMGSHRPPSLQAEALCRAVPR